MAQDKQKRTVLLENLMHVRDDLDSIIDKLSSYEWDFDDTPAVLNKLVLKDVLSRYATGEIQRDDVYKWADFLELRDDVDYPEEQKEFLSEVMHELANPELEGELTPDRAKSLILKMG